VKADYLMGIILLPPNPSRRTPKIFCTFSDKLEGGTTEKILYEDGV
jgi:hypothetical protein